MFSFHLSRKAEKMAQVENKLMKRRIANAYLSSLISISLVLFLIGTACFLFFSSKSVSDYFKENVKITVLLQPYVKDEEAVRLKDSLSACGFVKKAELISGERGKQELEQMLGEDFTKVFQTVPIPVSIEIGLNADNVEPGKIEQIKDSLSKIREVYEVSYRRSLVDSLHKNMVKIATVMGVFILLLLFISIVLITNTIRLVLYSQRFLLYTMKLVGATGAFIKKPYLSKFFLVGFASSIFASLMLCLLLFFVSKEIPQFEDMISMPQILKTISVIFACGMLLCTLTAYFITGSIIKLKKDDLYS